MLRVVLAVVLAAATVAAVAPAVEDARADRADAAGRRAADRVADAVDALVGTNDPVAAGPGARRVVRLSPSGGVGPRLDYVALGGVPGRSVARDRTTTDVIAYRVVGRRPRVVDLPAAVDLRVRRDGRLADDDEPLVVRDDATVVLGFLTREGRPTVVARRDRGFKTGNGTSRSHARPAPGAPRPAG